MLCGSAIGRETRFSRHNHQTVHRRPGLLNCPDEPPWLRGGSLHLANVPVARSSASSHTPRTPSHQNAIMLRVCGCWGEAEMAQQHLDVRPLAAKPSQMSLWSSKWQSKTTNYWPKPHLTFINPNDWVPGENLDSITHPPVRPAGALGARKTGVANGGRRSRDGVTRSWPTIDCLGKLT